VAYLKDAISFLFAALQFLSFSLLCAVFLPPLLLDDQPRYAHMIYLTLSSTRLIIPTNYSYNSEQIFYLRSLFLFCDSSSLFLHCLNLGLYFYEYF